MDVEIAEVPALRVGLVRGDLGHAQQTWERFGAVAGPAGLLDNPSVARAAILAVAAITGPARPNEVRYDAAVLLGDGESVPPGFIEDFIPGGRYAHAVHEGGYAGLATTWHGFVGDWLPQSGQRVGTGVCYEVYRPHAASAPELELRTDLYIPLV